jgi:hypothetical protein
VAADDCWGIPYNVVAGNSLTWSNIAFKSLDTADMSWDPTGESDCVVAASHTSIISPCLPTAAPNPVFPVPTNPLVEGGIYPDVASQVYGDHHLLVLDADTCRLWESYHVYTGTGTTWDTFGTFTWDLHSNALRTDTWTSADAAGFPMLPLIAKQAEAATGTIHHALRFTMTSSHIRNTYVWPARHLTKNGTLSTNLPPMGQLFRLKATYAIPATFSTQAKAILQALKTYGMYLADGGTDMNITGEPNANWDSTVLSHGSQISQVPATDFEAVDITAITQRTGFDANSGAVPP